jgi:2',3'-cyclic-nucleotide 2'-phosphodiesterase (5'-nucleotidase family)
MREITDRVAGAVVVCLAGASFACTIQGTPGEPFVPPAAEEPYLPTEPAQTTRRIVILHTNDEHSHLLGAGPAHDYAFLPFFDPADFTPGNWAVDDEGTATGISSRLAGGVDQRTVGGIVRRQYLINRERARARAAGDPVLLLSAGDVMMGSIYHVTYAAGQAPDYLAMAFLGYDFVTLGNHEFDFGPGTLAAAIDKAHQLTFGGAVPILSSNLHFEDVTVGGPGVRLTELYGTGDSGAPIMPWATRLLPNGLRVGLFGLTGYDAALVSSGLSPLTFSTPSDGTICATSSTCAAGEACVRQRCVDPMDEEAHLEALVTDAQVVVDILRNQKAVDLVVALTHLGVDEDNYLATHTDGIDVIVGGHSHTELMPTRVGDSLIVQAGDYGRKLGKLVVTVAPDGSIGYEAAESSLIDVSWSIDAAMRNDTALRGVETAVTFTAGLIGALTGGLNEQLVVTLANDFLGLPVTSFAQGIDGITSNHDIIGERANRDSYLAHLATDAALDRVANHKCFVDRPVVAVQANGVLRETLRFSRRDAKTTVADIFGVSPLGGSPWQVIKSTPGYPLLMFKLNALEMLIGLDVGVTKGLTSDSFFLSYAGMRTEYDTRRQPFTPTAANPWSTGRIVKIEVEEEPFEGDWYTLYDAHAAEPWKNASGAAIEPEDFFINIVANLYLAGFLDNYGLTPRDDDGDPYEGDTLLDRLKEASLCYNVGAMLSHDMGCLAGVAPVKMCSTLGGWPLLDELPQVKEWEAIALYLLAIGELPNDAYAGTEVLTADLRVRNVTP